MGVTQYLRSLARGVLFLTVLGLSLPFGISLEEGFRKEKSNSAEELEAASYPVRLSLLGTPAIFKYAVAHASTKPDTYAQNNSSLSKEKAQAERLKSAMPKLQIPFIENKGQLHEDVAYYAKTFGGTVFVTKDGGLLYNLPEGDKETKDHKKHDLITKEEDEKAPTLQKAVAVKETLVNGKVKAVKGESVSKAKVSYFKGNDPSKWQSGIQTYELVSLGEVYKGIDVKLKAYGKNVEKLFYVKPGAHPEVIKVRVDGGKLNVNENGELEVETELGMVRFTKPIAYQEVDGKEVEVSVSYRLIEPGTLYTFNVGEYDLTKPLVIDPLLASTFLGGSGDDYGYSIALDSSGNVYVTGYTYSSNYPTTTGAYDTSYNGGYRDVFVSKLSNDLSQLLASTFIGGSGYDYGYSIALDSSGNVYVTGHTESSNYPTTSGAYDTSYNSSGDVFVSKLSNDLTQLLASTFLGGSGYDNGHSIALDSSGNVYVTGYTYSSNYPITSGAYDTFSNFGYDAFVSKLSNDLTQLLASTFIGGSGSDEAFSIALDSSGNVYVTGYTYSSNYPTTSGAYDTSHNGYYDAFVSKLSNDLSQLLASTFIGGSGYDYGHSIALDSSGNVYVTGYTYSSNYPTAAGAYDTSYNGGDRDVFVSKLSNDLSQLLASTFIGGTLSDFGSSIALDSSGNVYVTGYTGSSNYPTTTGAYDKSYNGHSSDVFVSKLDTNLTQLLASTFIGGGVTDEAYSIALDSSGNVYVAGYTWSSDYPTKPGAYDASSNGYADVLVSKLDSNLSADTTYTLTLTKSGTGSGTVTSNPSGINCGADCSETYTSGSGVTLTATPASDSTFAGWGGGCSGCGTKSTCEITMNADRTCSATFNKVTTTTTTTTSTTTTTTTTTTIPATTTTTTLMPPTPPSGSFTLTVTRKGSSSSLIQATGCSLTWSGNTGTCTVNGGTSITLTPKPASGYTWNGWSDGTGSASVCQGENPCSFVITQNSSVTGTFSTMQPPGFNPVLSVLKAGTGQSTVTSTPPGISCGPQCSKDYAIGTEVSLAVITEPGSVFIGWSGDCYPCGKQKTCKITMDVQKACVAVTNSRSRNGWNLLGLTGGNAKDLDTLLGKNKDKVSSVWRWVQEGDEFKWGVALPGYESNGKSYAEAKGFSLIQDVEPGKGFWVRANNLGEDEEIVLTGDEIGTPGAKLSVDKLSWQLVSLISGRDKSIEELIQGKEDKITSIWKWDIDENNNMKWFVYLPGQEDKGQSYASSKGFGFINTIRVGEGFWVNVKNLNAGEQLILDSNLSNQ